MSRVIPSLLLIPALAICGSWNLEVAEAQKFSGCFVFKLSSRIHDCNDPSANSENICGSPEMPEETCTYVFNVQQNAEGQFAGGFYKEIDANPGYVVTFNVTYFGDELTDGPYAATLVGTVEGKNYCNGELCYHNDYSVIQANLTEQAANYYSVQSLSTNLNEYVSIGHGTMLGCTLEHWGDLRVYKDEPNPCSEFGLSPTAFREAPLGSDTDGDAVPDIEEDMNQNGMVDEGETDPNNVDTDGDGIWDGIERGYQVGIPGDPTYDMDPTTLTDPLIADSDGDNGWNGYPGLDGEEDANHNGKVDLGETDPLFSIIDRDSDGFTVSQDCKDNPIDDPPVCVSDPEYVGCAKNIHPGAVEIECNGIDEDCTWSDYCPGICASTVDASSSTAHPIHGALSVFKHLGYFLLPIGAVMVLSLWRRKR